MHSEQIDKLAIALSKAQAVMEAAAKNKRNPHFNSMYADLASIIEAVRKPLTDNGLAFTQTIQQSIEAGLFLETTLLHTSGQWIKSEYPLLQGTAQQTGSSLTYARRYSLSSIAGIAADEDDDGTAATKANGNRPQLRKASKEEAAPTKATATSAIKPYKIAFEQLPHNAGTDWRAFGNDLVGFLNDTETKSDLFEWLDKNKTSLAKMEQEKPIMFEKLTERINALKDEPT